MINLRRNLVRLTDVPFAIRTWHTFCLVRAARRSTKQVQVRCKPPFPIEVSLCFVPLPSLQHLFSYSYPH